MAAKEPTVIAGTTAQYYRGDKTWQTHDKASVGLSNVDNTSDASKPISTATQTALDAKQATSEKGAANGYASLDTNGKVPGSQLPNSIMTYEGLHDVSTNTPTLSDATGDAGQVYRVSVGGTRNYGSGSLTLNVGDYLIHSGSVWQVADTTDAVSTVNGYTGNITLTKSDVGLGSVDNTADAAKNVLSASKWTTARTLAGNSVDGSANVAFSNKFVVQGTADTGLSGAQFLGALGTGLVKNTTTTGVLSVATSGATGDYVAPGGALGTPSSGTLTNCTGLPVSGITSSTSTALGVGSLEVGHATDTSLTRSAAGKLAVEGVDVVLTTAGQNVTLGTVTPTALNVSSVGYLGMPANSQSAAYTLVATDAGKMILHPSSDNNARTFTIPANGSVAYPIGTVITFVNAVNTVTIAITTDTMTLAGSTTTGSRTLAANGLATAIKTGSTTWLISGVGLT